MSLPAAVQAIADGHVADVVWQNAIGGLTFVVDRGFDRVFVKWAPAGSGANLPAEAARMRWASMFTRVPAVIDEGCNAEGSWMVTAALPGESAVSDRWKRDPEAAVAGIGRGLRLLHDALPVDACPFSWSAESRVLTAHRLATEGVADPARWHPEHRHLTVDQALALIANPPGVDRLVVCHGDACAPNTLLAANGACSGHVDLGCLGIADRWADLAVAAWSTEWNYGAGLERRLLDAYGVAPDDERIRYYRLLWDLT